MPATITFRAKVESIHDDDGSVAYKRIKVPVIKATHCNMHEFRCHKTLRGFANSDLFPQVLKRALEGMGVPVGGFIRLDQIPQGVTIDTSKFLAVVTISIADDASSRRTTK